MQESTGDDESQRDESTGASLKDVPSFVITMTEEEFQKVKQRLESAGFHDVSRFAAINGKEKRGEVINDRDKLTYRAETEIVHSSAREAHSSMPSWGGVGCYLSHVALWEMASRSPNGILVFEADVKPFANARAEFEKKLKALVEHRSASATGDHGGKLPDMFFMGGFGYSPRDKTGTPKGAGISRLTDRKYGTEAYYVSPEGARKLLKDAFPMEVQVDSYIGYKILRGTQPNGARAFAAPDSGTGTGSSSSDEAFDAYIVDTYLAVQENLAGTSIQTKAVQGGDTSRPDWVLVAALIVVSLSGLLLLYFHYKKSK